MAKDVVGINLKSLEIPIYEALHTFQKITDERVIFDLNNASRLELTTNKPNSARSTTDVIHLGKKIGMMSVIAFAPFDGTGDESAFSVHNITGSPMYIWPITPKVVPRSKKGIDSEIHLPLTSQFTSRGHDPVLLAGHLQVLGFDDNNALKEIGQLGQSLSHFVNVLQYGDTAAPTTRLTTGYDNNGDRFGDPHSVYNALPNVLQVCAFLAIQTEMATEHRGLIEDLKAVPA